MRMLDKFKEIDAESWGSAGNWTGYNLVIGLAPIWLGIIIALICAPNATLMFVDRAQLAIYSTALLATGFYIVGREFKHVPLPGRTWFLLLMLAICLIEIAVFSVATIEDLSIKISGVINYVTLRWLSIGGFAISICVVLILQALNQSQEILDIRTEQAKQEEQLSKNFEQLGEKGSGVIRQVQKLVKLEEGNDEPK